MYLNAHTHTGTYIYIYTSSNKMEKEKGANKTVISQIDINDKILYENKSWKYLGIRGDILKGDSLVVTGWAKGNSCP